MARTREPWGLFSPIEGASGPLSSPGPGMDSRGAALRYGWTLPLERIEPPIPIERPLVKLEGGLSNTRRSRLPRPILFPDSFDRSTEHKETLQDVDEVGSMESNGNGRARRGVCAGRRDAQDGPVEGVWSRGRRQSFTSTSRNTRVCHAATLPSQDCEPRHDQGIYQLRWRRGGGKWGLVS